MCTEMFIHTNIGTVNDTRSKSVMRWNARWKSCSLLEFGS